MSNNRKTRISPIKVLVTDDHAIVRAGISTILHQTKEIYVIAEANNGVEALELTKKFNPDIVTLDIDMPNGHGVEAVQNFKRNCPKIKIIIVSGFSSGFFPSYFSKTKVHGYVTKEMCPRELVEAIQSVYDGKPYFSSDIVQQLARENLQVQQLSRFKQLTERELQVVVQMVKGRNNQEVADQNNVSDKTASGYRSKILKKLGLDSEVELLHLAIQDGLLFGY